MYSFNAQNSDVTSISTEQRTQETLFFTPLCRQDIYNILCKIPEKSTLPKTNATNMGFKSTPNISRPKKTMLEWSFKPGPPSVGAPSGQLSLIGCEFIRINTIDQPALELTYQAIDAIGLANDESIAVTKAFDSLLIKEYIPSWSEKDINNLSIYFIAAFGRLFAPPIDLEHIIRSRTLEKTEIIWLCSLPSNIITPLNRILELYQTPP
jgi:hypothetical protein